jgi:hypothetical protein
VLQHNTLYTGVNTFSLDNYIQIMRSFHKVEGNGIYGEGRKDNLLNF